jgi:hypothetical protein
VDYSPDPTKSHPNQTSQQADLPRLPWCVSCIALSLAGVIAWSAWDFGGGYLSTKLICFAAVALLLGVRMLLGPFAAFATLRVPSVALVAGLIWGMAMFQTLNLPSNWSVQLSPASHAAYTDWVPPSIRGEATLPGNETAERIMPLSIAPELTRNAATIPLAFAIAAFLFCNSLAAPRVVLAFMSLVALSGAAFAFLGLTDLVLTSGGSGRWMRSQMLVTPQGTGGAFGPFVNNINAGGFLNLAVACSMGVLVALFRRSSGQAESRSARQGPDSSRPFAADPRWKGPVRWTVVFLASATLVALIAGLFACRSRGAYLGCFAGAIGVSVVLLRSRFRSRAVLAVFFLAGVACWVLSAVGLFSHFKWRMESLWDGEAMRDTRLDHWQDSVRASLEYFPAGSGLGTYRYAYLPFQEHGGGRWYMHADGMPFEWLLEGGLWLPLMVILGIGLVVVDLFRLVKRLPSLASEERRAAEGLLVAALFMLPAMVVSQCFDYGILQPPLFLTVACLCGGLSKLANPHHVEKCFDQRGHLPRKPSPTVRKVSLLGAMTVIIVVGVPIGLRDLYVAASTQRMEHQRIALSRADVTDVPSFQRQISHTQFLLRLNPDSASAHRLCARLILDEQQRIAARYLSENDLAGEEQLRQASSPRTLRRAFQHSSHSAGVADSFEQLLLPGQDARQWRAARSHAANALVMCPLDDTARILLVELDFVGGDAEVASEALVDQVRQLRSRSASVLRFLNRL